MFFVYELNPSNSFLPGMPGPGVLLCSVLGDGLQCCFFPSHNLCQSPNGPNLIHSVLGQVSQEPLEFGFEHIEFEWLHYIQLKMSRRLCQARSSEKQSPRQNLKYKRFIRKILWELSRERSGVHREPAVAGVTLVKGVKGKEEGWIRIASDYCEVLSKSWSGWWEPQSRGCSPPPTTSGSVLSKCSQF